MNALKRYVQRRLAAAAICGFGAACAQRDAHAADGDVNPAALVAARELFREATQDVDAGRFEPALDKFKRVAAVRETPAVRFNIGRCEESLGKTGAALADFELAEREAKVDGKAGDIEKLAHERADALRPKVPRLTLTAPKEKVDGLTVSLDGTKLAPAALGVGLPVDPGPHVVEAAAPGRANARMQVAVTEGESKQVALELPPTAAGGPTNGDRGGPPPPDADQASGSRRTWGWIAVVSGAALGVGSLAFLFAERSAVSDLSHACPNWSCPSHDPSFASKASEARLDSGLSVGFGIGAVVVAGVGAYLLLTHPSPSPRPAPTAWISPDAPGAHAGLSLHATF